MANNRCALIVFKSEMTSEPPEWQNKTIDVSLTWIESFVGVATIVKDYDELEVVHSKFNFMVFGTYTILTVPDLVFQQIIDNLEKEGLVELFEKNKIRLSEKGIDVLRENWFIDRSVFTEARCAGKSLVNELGLVEGV